MWLIAGHEIGFSGGPYVSDQGDPMTAAHCYECPDGTDKGWMLWHCPDEVGEAVPVEPAFAAIVEHLRSDGVPVSAQRMNVCLMMAGLANDIEVGLDMLADQLKTIPGRVDPPPDSLS